MTNRSKGQQVAGLIGWIVLTLLAGGLGAMGSADAPPFYAQLQRPSWAPPPSVFGPVWSVLYVLMGLAVWLVWRQAGQHRSALVFFVVQLAVNALWSWLFFAWHMGGAAFADVLLLWALIVATMVAFSRVSKLAAGLLLPYLAWVSFASALTWAVWQANPALLK